MLVNYRSDYEKIAMGLLSFVPELKPLARLQQEMQWHLKSESRPVYLWRDEDDHFIGIGCCEVGEDYVLIRRLSFTPTNRTGRDIFGLLSAISGKYPGKRLMGTLETQPIVTNWRRMQHGQ